jgi:hypothetical protein
MLARSTCRLYQTCCQLTVDRDFRRLHQSAQRRRYRKPDVNIAEAPAAAAAIQLQVCRDALEEQSALFRRQRVAAAMTLAS